jgi:hypothetical protein
MVFEDATIGTAIISAVALIRQDYGSTLFYSLMEVSIDSSPCHCRGALALGCGTCCGNPSRSRRRWGLAGASPHRVLRHHDAYVSLPLLSLAFFVFMFTAIVCTIGAVLIFYQAYALYFLGGPIPAIGDLLEPPPPPMMEVTPPPFVPA